MDQPHGFQGEVVVLVVLVLSSEGGNFKILEPPHIGGALLNRIEAVRINSSRKKYLLTTYLVVHGHDARFSSKSGCMYELASG